VFLNYAALHKLHLPPSTVSTTKLYLTHYSVKAEAQIHSQKDWEKQANMTSSNKKNKVLVTDPKEMEMYELILKRIQNNHLRKCNKP
jgi:primosomal replication protein N